MLHKFLCVWACLCLFTTLATSQSTSLQAKIDHIMAPLPTDPILSSSKIWIDKVPRIIDPDLYDGKDVPDSIRFNSHKYLTGYKMIRNASLSPTDMPPYDSLKAWVHNARNAAYVPISVSVIV